MDGSYIPPPFPFPEAWPRVFVEQQHERRWLTPTTFAAVQSPVQMTAVDYYSVDPSIHAGATVAQDEDTEEDEEDDEYEYGYVLSDEWRERFQSSVYLQQQQQKLKTKKKKPQNKKKFKQHRQTVNAEAIAAAYASRSGHLQREIQAAKTRELTRKWKRRGGVDTSATPQIEALETSLNMVFDEFCDAFQPVVWPHDPLQR